MSLFGSINLRGKKDDDLENAGSSKADWKKQNIGDDKKKDDPPADDEGGVWNSIKGSYQGAKNYAGDLYT